MSGKKSLNLSEIKPSLLIVSHTPLVAHFFLREHIKSFGDTFDVLIAHNTNIDTYCPGVSDLCREYNLTIQRRFAIWGDLWAVIQLSKLVTKIRPKVVLSLTPKSGLIGMLVARIFRIGIRVHIFQGEVWPNRTGIIRKILQFCDALIIRNSTHLLCVSSSERDLLQRTFRINAGKLDLLGKGTICGVKPNFFLNNKEKRKQAQQIYDVPVNTKVCVYVGRICEEKGLRDLIAAFCQLNHTDRDKRLILVGPEENFSVTSELQKWPVDIADLISIHPFTDDPSLVLSKSDFLCLPSHREGFGLTIIEAAAMGLPAIGSRIIGISDAIVDNETGLMHEVKNVSDLSRCMQKMFDDDTLRREMGRKAKLRAHKYFRQLQVVSLYDDYIRGLK
jgi:glycosyltransferase involved in cell wall biosynthesis